MTTDVPAGPVAYCAPGQTATAVDLLEDNDLTVTEIKEHPWLTGAEVFVIHPEAFRLSEHMPWKNDERLTFGSPEWWQESLLSRVGEFAAAGSDARVEERPADFRQPQAG